MFKKILIANRGEIACRIMRTVRRLGLASVAVYSEADEKGFHVKCADEAVCLGPAPAQESYLRVDKIVEACLKTGADAVHPGYGFLSERAELRRALENAGIAFIGPPLHAIEAMGDKITSKKMAAQAGVSTVPGYVGELLGVGDALEWAETLGYPVMIKASAGGGGKGMRIAWKKEDIAEGFERARSEALSSFGDGRLFMEKFIVSPRHIEIQVLGDQHGTIVHLGERECSLQRRNQKVIEEAPSPLLSPQTRIKMGEQAVALARAVGYYSAGTVEFVVDQNQNFYFLEMNTRLQVEHPVTEWITGIDLVEQMISVAQGEKLPFSQSEITFSGWAMESRIYAEDPKRNFLPAIGRLVRYRPPKDQGELAGNIREDSGVYEGDAISMYYDPMIAKLSVHGKDRQTALKIMSQALDSFDIQGVAHNLSFLSAMVDHPTFQSGEFSTDFIPQTFPDGFALYDGALQRYGAFLAKIAVVVDHRENLRKRQITGQMPGKKIKFTPFRVVSSQQGSVPIELISGVGNLVFLKEEGAVIEVESDYQPGDSFFKGRIDGEDVTILVTPILNGYRLRYRGCEDDFFVYTPQEAQLMEKMPKKTRDFHSKTVLCPMPGLVLKVCVTPGQEIEIGEPILVMEAMKMENVVRAERAGRVSCVCVKEGQSLPVEAVLLEFEGV